MKAQIEDISTYEKIASYFSKLASEEDKWGKFVALRAHISLRALDIIKTADIQKVEECFTPAHTITAVFTADHVVAIHHAYGKCVHTHVTVGDKKFVVSDRDNLVIL